MKKDEIGEMEETRSTFKVLIGIFHEVR